MSVQTVLRQSNSGVSNLFETASYFLCTD